MCTVITHLPTRLKKSRHKRDTRAGSAFRQFITTAWKCAGSIYFRRHPIDWMHHTLSDVTHSSAAWTAIKGNRRGDRRRQTGGMGGICFVCAAWIWTRVSFKYLYLKLLYIHGRYTEEYVGMSVCMCVCADLSSAAIMFKNWHDPKNLIRTGLQSENDEKCTIAFVENASPVVPIRCAWLFVSCCFVLRESDVTLG